MGLEGQGAADSCICSDCGGKRVSGEEREGVYKAIVAIVADTRIKWAV